MAPDKCGVVWERRLSHWFDPLDVRHLRAWACRQRTGVWPPGFRPEDVWEDPGWERVVAAAVGDRLPAAVTAWAEEYDRLVRVVLGVYCPGHVFLVGAVGDQFTLRVDDVGWRGPTREGRPVLFPPGLAAAAVARLCFDAVVASLVGWAGETFVWRGGNLTQRAAPA